MNPRPTDERNALLLDLLAEGVGYFLAREAIASTAMSHDDECQTFAVDHFEGPNPVTGAPG